MFSFVKLKQSKTSYLHMNDSSSHTTATTSLQTHVSSSHVAMLLIQRFEDASQFGFGCAPHALHNPSASSPVGHESVSSTKHTLITKAVDRNTTLTKETIILASLGF
jgi:hypothetical protein